MSTIKTNEITARSGAGTILVPSGNHIRSDGMVIQTVSKTWNDSTQTTTADTYIVTTNGSLNITTRSPNSRLFVMLTAQGYSTNGGGVNFGLSRTIGATTTRLIGTNGGAGDTWMGDGNGLSTSNSFSISREILDTPAVAAGTVITYTALLGKWSSNAGTVFFNYPGYTGGSTLTIIEIATV
jgi:hypothetical protein